MPIYEFECETCETIFEELRKRSDKSPATCSCGSVQTHRIMSNTAFSLKGGGWYVTDYSKAGTSTKPADSTASEASDGDSKTSASDSSTATKNGSSSESSGSSSESTPAPKSASTETTSKSSDSNTSATSSND